MKMWPFGGRIPGGGFKPAAADYSSMLVRAVDEILGTRTVATRRRREQHIMVSGRVSAPFWLRRSVHGHHYPPPAGPGPCRLTGKITGIIGLRRACKFQPGSFDRKGNRHNRTPEG